MSKAHLVHQSERRNRSRGRQEGRGVLKLILPVAALLILTSVLVGCGGDDDPPQSGDGGASVTPAGNLGAQIVTSMLSVGKNRFAMGIFDEVAGQPVLDGDVNFRFFKVAGNQGTLRFEGKPRFVGFDTSYIDGRGQRVAGPPIGVYVADVEFNEAGDWGIEASGTVQGRQIEPILIAFKVLPPDQVISIGDPAPPSRQLTTADVDISAVDTMQPPDPFHDTTIAAALQSGRPALVLFGTPAFCETRTCGPVMETVMLPLYQKYGAGATFIHVEPFRLQEARSGQGLCPVPSFNREFARTGQGEGSGKCPMIPEAQLGAPTESWNLTTEPVLFLIDRQGRVSGIFEGIVGPQEVEGALQPLLAP